MSNEAQALVENTAHAVRKAKRSANFDMLWRVLVILGLVANLWLNKNYVSRDDYRADLAKRELEDKERDKQIRLLSDTVLGMQNQNAINMRHDKEHEDYESRLRRLELMRIGGKQKPPSNEGN